MVTPLRVAALGAGYFSQFHFRAWQRIAGAELVAICDRNAARAAAAAAQYGVPASFDDIGKMLDAAKPDVLDVVAPPAAHMMAIEAAAARGINVICQKPFCGDLAGAERAVSLAEAAGISLIVHENVRFQPWYLKMKEMLAQGTLGAVFGTTFRIRPGDGRGENAYMDRQPYFRDMKRFFIHETGIHFIDVIRYLLGEVTSVSATLRRLNPGIAGEDTVLVVLETAGGAMAVLDGNRLVDHVATNRRRTMGEVLIEAEAGVLRLNGDGELYLRPHLTNDEQAVGFEWHDTDFGGDCVYGTQVAAIAALTGTGPAINSGRDYLANLRIEEAIYRSASEGRRIETQ